MRRPVLNKDFFNSEDAVINHVRVMGLERPAPVAKGVRCAFVGSMYLCTCVGHVSVFCVFVC